PNNVTIFGQSGGGRTVTWMMTSPEARGYFQKAIALAARQNPLPDMTKSVHGMRSQVEDAAGFIQGLGVTSMEELRALPTDKVMISAAEYQAGDFGGAFIDGQVIIGDPIPLFSEGKQAPVPFMIGTNSWDSGFFLLSSQPKDLDTYITSIGLDPAAIAPLYADIPECLQVTDAEGDAWYLGGVKMLAGEMKGIAPGYAYYFDHVTEKIAKPYPGAMHQWEIPFVFGSIGLVQQPAALDVTGLDSCDIAESGNADMNKGDFPATFAPTADAASAEDIALSEEVSAYWANFARTGNPNGEGAEWPVYDPAQDEVMVFTNQGEPVKDLHDARVDPQIGMMEKVYGIEAP
ncbi:MAG: carboxylesterase family protein, partial [Thermomicrobiales bacterium]